MKMKTKSITLILTVAMLLLSACGNQTQPSSSQGAEVKSGNTETIKIGVVTGLSGSFAAVGKDVIESIQFAADEVNEKGGLLGKKIEILKEDDEGKADTGLRKAEKVVTKDGAHFLLGTISSAVALAIAAKMPEWNSIYVSAINRTPKLTNLNKNTFVVNANDNDDMHVLDEWYKTNKKIKSWYMIGSDYEYGHNSVAEFKKIVEKNGDKVVGEAFTALGTTDFSSQITKILNSGVDGVWVAVSGVDCINFLKQAKSFGLSDKVKIGTILNEPVVYPLNKDGIGIFGPANYHASLDIPKNKEFVTKYEKKFGKEPNLYHAMNYNAAVMLFKAIEKAGSIDTQKVISSFEGMKFDSLLGEITMRAEDHKLQLPDYFAEVVDAPKGVTFKILATYK